MSKLWLPFYDLGGPIGPGQPNHPLDIELFVFLSSRLRPMMRVPNLPPIGPTDKRPTAGKPPARYTDEWVAALVNYCNHSGFVVQLMPPKIIAPMSAGGSLIVAMNALYHRFWPEEFLSPSFTDSTSGQLVAGTLPWHMLTPGNMRSPWLGVRAGGSGPVREMPFYDVNAVTYANPENSVQLADPLVSELLKVICWSNPLAKPPSIVSFGVTSSVSAHGIIIFGQHFQQLGWSCADYANVHPTYGQLGNTSLIKPINYYAWQGCAQGMVGLSSGGYIDLLKSPFLPTSLRATLRTNRASLYFSL